MTPEFKAKLKKIYELIDHVDKNGENTSQHYHYVRAADVVHLVRKTLADLGIYAEVNMTFDGGPYTIARAKDPSAPFAAVNVKCSVVLHDVDSDSYATGSGLGTGCDTGDKAVYKAQTGALKYALRNVTLLADEENTDPEADETVDEEPNFQDARRGRPAPSHVEPKSQRAQENQKTAQTQISERPSSVPKAEIPAAAPVQQTLPKSSTVSTASADIALPTEQEMIEYRNKFKKLGDDLSEPAKGGLKTSRSNPINRKILAYLLTYVGAKNATEVSKGQWTNFLAHVDDVIAKEGYKSLAEQIDPEAFKK